MFEQIIWVYLIGCVVMTVLLIAGGFHVHFCKGDILKFKPFAFARTVFLWPVIAVCFFVIATNDLAEVFIDWSSK